MLTISPSVPLQYLFLLAHTAFGLLHLLRSALLLALKLFVEVEAIFFLLLILIVAMHRVGRSTWQNPAQPRKSRPNSSV